MRALAFQASERPMRGTGTTPCSSTMTTEVEPFDSTIWTLESATYSTRRVRVTLPYRRLTSTRSEKTESRVGRTTSRERNCAIRAATWPPGRRRWKVRSQDDSTPRRSEGPWSAARRPATPAKGSGLSRYRGGFPEDGSMSGLPASRTRVVVRLHAAAPERVHPSPPARDVEQLEVADPGGDGRVDDEMVADRLEPEHGPEEQERRARGPGLRTAGGRVQHRVLRHLAWIPCERLGQPAVEESGGGEDPRGDPRRLLLEAVPAQSPRDDRVVEGPHRADVITDRVVPALSLSQRPNTPAGKEPLAHEVSRHRLRLGSLHDATPQEVADVRRQ